MINRERPQRRPFVSRRVTLALIIALLLVLAFAFAVPLLTARAAIQVPDLIGLDEDVARVRLAQADLVLEVSERPFDPAPAGTVLNQEPGGGATVFEGDSVFVVVSAGSEEFVMPDVVGVSVRVARAQLEQRGLTVRVDPVESDAPKDTVLSSNPAPGAKVRTSDIVRLTIAAEGSAADALLPYSLQGLIFIVDPAEVPSGTVDASMEVSRRLQSLLEASGATVHISRDAAASDTSAAGRLSRLSGITPAVVIGFDVPATGAAGVRITTLSEGAAGAYAEPSDALANEMVKQLAEGGTVAKRTSTGSDLILQAFAAPGVRVALGAQSSPDDLTLFRDPAWSDAIARALYRGIGERFGPR